MKQFFKFFFASLLGTITAFILAIFGFLFFLMIFVSIFEPAETISISPNTILELNFTSPVPDRTYYDPLKTSDILFPSIGKRIGLNDVIKNIRKAKDDINISGIYLKLDNFNAGGYATIEAIRNELINFKESGKFIIAHGNYISQRAYYLASVADKIFITPTGDFDFKGLSAEVTFFKKTLEKLDIDTQIFKSGKYKSAVEIFENEKLSSANREQISEYLNSIYNRMLKSIENEREIEYLTVKNIADNMLVREPQDAYKFKLVDSLLYEVDVRKELKQLCGITEAQSLKFIPIKKYMRTEGKTGVYSSNRIAVIYALGEIHFGKGDETSIGMENIVQAIRKAVKNKYVKSIVMRVNSGGGVALTADIIWKEVQLAREKKPFIVSFGPVAASGGYYIACAADTIVAEPNTLTGSIGAFAVVPNMNKFFDNKLGITFDRVRTGKYSDLITTTRGLTKDEKAILTNHVNMTYDTFVNRVAAGRGMTFNEVNKIGQGRIWSGTEAKEIGLVDVIGGLDVAVDIAAEKAGIDNYKVVEYPKIRETFEQILEILYEDVSASIFQKEIGAEYKFYTNIINMLKANEVQTRLPFDVEIY